MTLGRLLLCLFVWTSPATHLARAADDFAPLAARYRETRSNEHAPPRSSAWYLTRNGSRVEMGSRGYVELWERDERGEVSWRRIFHDDSKVIAYTPGELRAQRRARPWATLNSVVDAPLLAGLHPVGKTRYLDRPATRYAGNVGKEQVQVVWLDEERLAGRVVRGDQWHIYYSLVLEELRPTPGDDWPRSDLARAQSYELIDGADLGDREYDPFVRKVLAMDGHSHAH